MKTNVNPLVRTSEVVAASLAVIASPQRIAILLAVGKGEACVCHLETALGWRQAYISQHLMALRKAGILQGRRAGKFIYYKLVTPGLLDFIVRAAALAGISGESVLALVNQQSYPACDCPQCAPVFVKASSL